MLLGSGKGMRVAGVVGAHTGAFGPGPPEPGPELFTIWAAPKGSRGGAGRRAEPAREASRPPPRGPELQTGELMGWGLAHSRYLIDVGCA